MARTADEVGNLTPADGVPGRLAATEAATAHPQASNANADPPLQADAGGAQLPRQSGALQADPPLQAHPPCRQIHGQQTCRPLPMVPPQAALAARVPAADVAAANLQASNAESDPQKAALLTAPRASKNAKKSAPSRSTKIPASTAPTLQHWGTTFFGKEIVVETFEK